MTRKPHCDWIATSTGWAHCTKELYVHKIDFRGVLLIIPIIGINNSNMNPIINNAVISIKNFSPLYLYIG